MRIPFLLTLLLLLGSCAQENKKEVQNSLRINFQDGDLPSTHPHVGIDYRMRSLQSALFEQLTRMDERGIPQPAAAVAISVSRCQTRYTFTLRPAKWSNNAPVTASQFAAAWKKAVAKDSFCRRPDLFYIIKNAEKVKKGEADLSDVGIHAVDEMTLEIELEHPAPYFLELISNPIFSPLYDNSEEPSVFNGPFILDQWKRDRAISLKKNPLYWDAQHVKLDTIEILVITDPLTAVQLFEKGELDWIGSPFSSLPNDMIPAFQKTGMLKTKEVARIYWLYCNTDLFPFNNPAIRKALCYAIDRNALVEHVLLGQAPALTPLPDSLTLLGDAHLPLLADARQAQQFFSQGLQELGLSLETFPPIVLSHSHIAGQRQLAEVIQNAWKEVLGVKVTLTGSEWNVFFSDLSHGKYQVGGCIKSALFRDPIHHLELLQDKTHLYNVCRWENRSYQNLLQQARSATDIETRNTLLRSAEEILLEQMPVIPIYSEVYLYMIRPHIQGIVIHDLGHVDFKWAKWRSIDRHRWNSRLYLFWMNGPTMGPCG
jgi:oligopeptide transport system substrate-binding protein